MPELPLTPQDTPPYPVALPHFVDEHMVVRETRFVCLCYEKIPRTGTALLSDPLKPLGQLRTNCVVPGFELRLG